MNIALVIPVWKRPNITFAVLSYYRRMQIDGVRFDRIAVCSTDEDERVALACGFRVVRAENEPLNEKHNAGARAIHGTDVDVMVHINSDDVITPQYFETVKLVAPGFSIVRFASYVFHNTETGETCWTANGWPGSGTAIRRSALARMDYEPWAGEPIDRMLDTRLYDNIGRADLLPPLEFQTTPDTAMQICSLKSGTNLWSYDDHTAMVSTGPVDTDQYFARHFPDVLDSIPHV